MIVEENVTRRHGSLSVGSCASEKPVCCLWSRFQRMFPVYSPCIAGDDFVIKMTANEESQSSRGMQRGEWFRCSFLSFFFFPAQRNDGDVIDKAAGPPSFICWPSVLQLPAKSTYWLLRESARSCQMTSNANLHINVFSTAPCTLERKGLYRSHYMESLGRKW